MYLKCPRGLNGRSDFSNAEGLKELLTNSKSHLTTLFISLSPRVLN